MGKKIEQFIIDNEGVLTFAACIVFSALGFVIGHAVGSWLT